MKGDAFVKFDVYVNVVNHTIIIPKFGEFSGIFVHIPKGVGFRERDHGGDIVRRKTVLELGVSEQLKDLEVDTDESIWITSLPRTAAAATIEGIRIEYIK